jgi:hypothetical protein
MGDTPWQRYGRDVPQLLTREVRQVEVDTLGRSVRVCAVQVFS